MLQKLRGSNQKGFTLIELMIVIAIIGILSAIAIPNFLSYRAKGQDTSAKTEASNFYSAAMAEFADTGSSKAFSSANLPSGFAKNADVNYSGTITVAATGATSGTMTFTHSKSSTAYTLTGSTGDIS